MKKWFRMLLCSLLLIASATLPALAAEDGLLIAPNPNASARPEKQGAFYVLLNGEYATFTDAVPQIKNDRSCLPFVAVFDQLGFGDMTWNGETSTVTATKEGVTISLTIGKQEILVTENGETRVIPTDVAPYIDPALSRTYIPFGLVAAALDYKVGWDADLGAVIIDDLDAILAENEASYDLMDKYLEYGRTMRARNYKVTGEYYTEVASMETLDEETDLTTIIAYGGEYEMLMKAGGSAFQFDGDLYMDMAFAVNGEDATDLMLTLAGMDGIFPLAVEYKQLGDASTNTLYSYPASDYIMGGDPAPAGTWEKSALDASSFATFTSFTGAAMPEGVSLDDEDTSFEDVVRSLLRQNVITSVDYTSRDLLAELNDLYADSAFTRSGSSYTSEMITTDTAMALTLYTSGNRVTGYGMEMASLDEAGGVTTLTLVLDDLELAMVLEYVPPVITASESDMSMYMEMTGTYRATSRQPETVPPAGAVILDLTAADR